jgi:hypothetical protein
MGTSEFDFRGENTLHWGVSYMIGKLSKCSVENGLAWTIWTFVAQVITKRKVGSQIGSLTPDHQKSRIVPTRCVQAKCDTLLKSSWRGLQLCFKPHRNWRFAQEVMRSQNCESPSCWKKPFGCDPRGELQSILYGGRWWLPSSLGRGESCESKVACGLS